MSLVQGLSLLDGLETEVAWIKSQVYGGGITRMEAKHVVESVLRIARRVKEPDSAWISFIRTTDRFLRQGLNSR